LAYKAREWCNWLDKSSRDRFRYRAAVYNSIEGPGSECLIVSLPLMIFQTVIYLCVVFSTAVIVHAAIVELSGADTIVTRLA
jgi:hypothetical protein